MLLSIAQSGFEKLLIRELEQVGCSPLEEGPGWALCNQAAASSGPENSFLREAAFPHLTLLETSELKAESVNALGQALCDYFLQSLRGERIEAAWPLFLDGPSELVGLGRRIKAVAKVVDETLRKRLSRVAKLAQPGPFAPIGTQRGLFVWFADFQRCFVSRAAFYHGQCRMADDDLAPSRSYLKVEEAYCVLGIQPGQGETVADLGAAPGGWSYSAAKRGARVYAVDNGPMKGGALDNPLIEHLRQDAFGFVPPGSVPCDWLFCDMVEEPHHVLRDIVDPWLTRSLCRRYVVNLKFGRVDPIELLRELHSPSSPFAARSSRWHVAHLFHDREEFTVVGELPPPSV
jgi:23S rRNA (cytidine2498-2'-O)-methyltransferase